MSHQGPIQERQMNDLVAIKQNTRSGWEGTIVLNYTKSDIGQRTSVGEEVNYKSDRLNTEEYEWNAALGPWDSVELCVREGEQQTRYKRGKVDKRLVWVGRIAKTINVLPMSLQALPSYEGRVIEGMGNHWDQIRKSFGANSSDGIQKSVLKTFDVLVDWEDCAYQEAPNSTRKETEVRDNKHKK